MIRRPPRSTLDRSSAASDVYKRQLLKEQIERLEAEKKMILLNPRYMLLQKYIPDTDDIPDVNWLKIKNDACLLYTSPSPRDRTRSRMPSSA